MKRNIKLIIEYDGTNYVGWQRQLNGPSIQKKIESVLAKITNEKVTVIGAGRTDSGVHARGQTANFFIENKMGTGELQRALNGLLPHDIVIKHTEEVDEHFSARHSAKEREYKYYISSVPTAIQRKFVWQAGYRLDFSLMNSVAASIIGEHDFASFCKGSQEFENHLCNVVFAEWIQQDTLTIFTIRANRFLHGMVRSLVGTMVDVGRGLIEYNQFEKIISSKDRQLARQSVPAKGLFLEKVVY